MSSRVSLGDGWTLWRDFAIRGAGFPVGLLASLADPELADLVDQQLAADDRVDEARRAAIEIGLKPWGEHPPAARKLHLAAMKKLRTEKAPAPIGDDSELAVSVEHVLRYRAERDAIATAVRTKLEAATLAAKIELRVLAADPKVRAAIAWQNRDLLANGIDPLARTPAETTDAKTRQRELTLASYLQRYCAKSDTIAFFGPVGFGAFGDATHVSYGANLVARSQVYFEHWGIHQIAQRFGRDPQLRALLHPRRAPTVRLDGTTIHIPVDRTLTLPLPFSAALALCDGARSASSIATELSANAELELELEDAFDVLDELETKRLIVWGLEVPTSNYEPETALTAALADLDAHVGTELRELLAELERLRARVELATTAEDIDRGLAELETAYTRSTELDATRAHGKMYAGRTLVYLEAKRDMQLTLGAGHADSLARPLALLMQAGRWYTYEIAARFRAVCELDLEALCNERGSNEIDYLTFLDRVSAHFNGGPPLNPPPTFVKEVVAELQRKWGAILAAHGGATTFDSAALRADVEREFAAPGPGWPLARHQAPDLIVAGTDLSDPAKLLYVIGEIHVGGESFTQFWHMFDDAAKLAGALEADVPTKRLSPVVPFANARMLRTASIAGNVIDVEMGAARSHRSRDRVVAASELVVVRGEHGAVVRDREGTHTFDIVTAFEELLSSGSSHLFHILSPQPHTPRITIDQLVISRARWTFMAAELTFAHDPDPTVRFVAARRWARAIGLPRYVFYKVPEEQKPFYLDFASPLFVDLFLKIVRSASTLNLSEMLPTPDQCWLSDAAGELYVSELRMVAVDPAPYVPR